MFYAEDYILGHLEDSIRVADIAAHVGISVPRVKWKEPRYLALPNNYTEDLIGDRRPYVTPCLVRRAEGYLEAHATEPITISDVVAQCSCSRTALFNAFRTYRGYTPIQFLADTRLRAARVALQSPSSNDSVTSIAYACGFSHLGRFSQAYRLRFGESPSETLRKSR